MKRSKMIKKLLQTFFLVHTINLKNKGKIGSPSYHVMTILSKSRNGLHVECVVILISFY